MENKTPDIYCTLCGYTQDLKEGEEAPKKCPACNDNEEKASRIVKAKEVINTS